MIFSSIQNKALRITARVFATAIVVLFVLLSAVSIYINANKKTILEKVHAVIRQNIAGRLELKDIDVSTISTFPYIAIDLEEVQLLDAVYNKALLSCKTISCRINIFKIGDIQHQLSKVVMKNGLVSLFTDTTGYTNSSILFRQQAKKTQTRGGFVIKTVALENIDFGISNEQKKKTFSFHIEDLDADLSQKDSGLYIKTRLDLLVKKMIFNQAKGSYLENNPVEGKLDVFYNNVAKTLTCREGRLDINEQPYKVKASFNFGNAPAFNIDITSDKLLYEKGIEALTPKLRNRLKAITLEEPLSLHVTLGGLLTPGNIPVALAEWETKKNRFGSGAVMFDDCSFKGKFTNNISDTLPHTDMYSMVMFDTFFGKWRGLALTGNNIKVSNLVDPQVTFSLSSSATLQEIDNAIGSETVTFLEGSAGINLSYDGPLVADPAQLSNLNAALQIKDGKMLYEPKNVMLEKCTGLMVIQENGLIFKDFQFDFKRNHFTLNVKGDEMANLSKKVNQKANLDFDIRSPYIHFDEIFQVIAPTQKKAVKKRKPHFAATANNVDNLLNTSNWHVNFYADKISKGNFYAEKLQANILLQEDNWQISHVSLYHAGGAITAKGQLLQRSNKSSQINADVALQNLNIQQLFFGFGNFGQNSLTSANLRGVLNADARINASVNNAGAIIPRSTSGYINFSLKNGAIINHKGLEEMKLLFLKNRDMSNVRFAELKDRIDIKPEYLYINKMEIQSSAVSMYLEGQFDIYAKNTDLMIQVPFSNFGKRDESEPIKNKGLDAKTGLSIWINAKNNDYGEIKFTPRFSRKKFKKEKKEQ
ncbi:hypothetical protein I5907_05280 [Panacibacter sp. DH6]|uniref:AsmA-like C-terminal domain-containing protein n=1 Tax=Panacibacter microcysteis TaxID=2793269 RepID=A0A931E5H0_9BACT|nr:AsmA-like C-terminal region-containing protein [Panacibacter microcysteis]MBG9375635.1 hypothetical protein [Panacibacter microcysteis]